MRVALLLIPLLTGCTVVLSAKQAKSASTVCPEGWASIRTEKVFGSVFFYVQCADGEWKDLP
jgi:hypothetical protein